MVAKAAYGWDSESCVWELKQLMSGVQGQNIQGGAYMEDMPNAGAGQNLPDWRTKVQERTTFKHCERSDIFLSNETNAYSLIQHFQIKISLTETKI